MQLQKVVLKLYRNFVDEQHINVENDVTCFVGKNESGKTTVLQALHRLKPANGSQTKFDLTTEYPRWRLVSDRRKDPQLDETEPIRAEFSLSDEDRQVLQDAFEVPIPAQAVCWASRSYSNKWRVGLRLTLQQVIEAAAENVGLSEEDLRQLISSNTLSDLVDGAKQAAKEQRTQGDSGRAKKLTAFASESEKYAGFLDDPEVTDEQRSLLWNRVPSFFYFSNYDTLPGETNLTELTGKISDEADLDAREVTLLALLNHAGVTPTDFLEDDYASRKAELQAASSDLSRRVFRYWTQNPDLSVVFDADNRIVQKRPNGTEIANRFLMIELRDARHGDVETNFDTRSTGFQWFFSFFAAFSAYQDRDDPVIVLLDEPGTSLHGDAQHEFVDYIFSELGASQQTLYTTHSQHMVDPARYEKLRAVYDRATRENPDLGVIVTHPSLSPDVATILPIESALGYSVSRHLFIGSGQHLVVEGSSDFVYIQRLTEHFANRGKTGLDPRLAIIPVGSADNMPAFVALLGRRLKVSALLDGAKTSARLNRVRAAATSNRVPETAIVTVSQVEGMPSNADIEDLFTVSDYLKLYNWAFSTNLQPQDLPATTEPILKRLMDVLGHHFDHALPAHNLTEHRIEFFAGIEPETEANFENLFKLLNATLQE